MIRSTPMMIVLLLAVLLVGSAWGQLIHTLLSPNEAEYNQFGLCVSGGGDVNNDGYDDLLVASPGYSGYGRAYAFCGQTGDVLFDFYEGRWDEFGCSVGNAGDVDNDGHDDIVVGAMNFTYTSGANTHEQNGCIYIFSGQDGGWIYRIYRGGWDYSHFGCSVSGAGDVNVDGFDDVITGAYNFGRYVPNGAGGAWISSGQSGEDLYYLEAPNAEEEGHFGWSVSGAGDVNGDGHADVIVGAPNEDPGSSPSSSGRTYVFDGQTGLVLHELVSPNEEAGGHFGWSVSDVGDANGDGYDDVVVGAYNESPNTSPEGSGRAYVFSGRTGELMYELHAEPHPEEEDARFGWSVSGAGDTDADGYDDIIVGAVRQDPFTGTHDAGEVYVFSGRTGNALHYVRSPNEEVNGAFGYSVSCAGNIDGDAYDDVIVGAPYEDAGWPTLTDAGRAYVFNPTGVPADHAESRPGPGTLRIVGPSPNPVTDHVRLTLIISPGEPSSVGLDLYDVNGRLVESVLNGWVQGDDAIDVTWSPRNALSSGLYCWRLSAGPQTAQKTMVIVRK